MTCPACNSDGRSEPCAFCPESLESLLKASLERVKNRSKAIKLSRYGTYSGVSWGLNGRRWFKFAPGQIVEVTEEEMKLLIHGTTIEDILEARK